MNWKLLDQIGGLILFVVFWWLSIQYIGDGEIGLWEIFVLIVGLMILALMFREEAKPSIL